MPRRRRIPFAAVSTAALAVAAFAGCVNPATTRLPTVFPSGDPAENRRSLEHFDPYADQTLGPDTVTRPQSFRRSREPQRGAQEGRLLRDVPAVPVAPGYSTGAYRDDAVVR